MNLKFKSCTIINGVRHLLFFMFFIPAIGNGLSLFIGDSLTYQLALSYQKQLPVNARYLEGTGLYSTKLFDWSKYIRKINFGQYDKIYIVFGTNDLISKNEIYVYREKVQQFIRIIKQYNSNIVWVLPPTLQNKRKNALLKNTRIAIITAVYNENITMIDMQEILGTHYNDNINGIKVRTTDGVHITKEGADLIINFILETFYH
nr:MULTISPECIES: GDSL-type esterase/lipase family protein [unclassified Providencia]